MRTTALAAIVAASALLALTFGVSADDGTDIDQTIAELEETVRTLERRITHLKDIEQIENLVSAYGYYLDKQQWDHFTDLFAEDSKMEISRRGIYFGKAGVRRALELFGPQNILPGHLHNHIQLQPVITVAPDGQRAWIRSRALSQLGTYERIGVWGDGVYENELVKENGVWKFKSDHVYTTFFAPYDQGWATGARAAPGPSEKIPPDAPSSEIYQAYPDVYIPAFHYRHPVTGAEIKVPRGETVEGTK